MEIPAFVDLNAGSVYKVRYQEIATQARVWAEKHSILPSSLDSERTRTCLLVIDAQNTFCNPEFELFVRGHSGTGAVDDSKRTAEFIYTNVDKISTIVHTLDTHFPYQIFHTVFWQDPDGNHPAPGTVIRVEDVVLGRWSPLPETSSGRTPYLEKHALNYVRRLKKDGKPPLIVWPFHAMAGGIGHCITPAIEEATFFHSIARRSQPILVEKGKDSLTEFYAATGPEVEVDHNGVPTTMWQKWSFYSMIMSFSRVYICGQAKSHCVAATVNGLIEMSMRSNPDNVRKIHLLEDCTSPVVIPGMDFTEQADKAYQSFRDAGVYLVKSTDPIES